MATPITWRNVRGGSDATSARLMDSAGQSFDGMFNELDNVLQTKNNQLERRDTDAFKQLLAKQYGNDPEAFAQAQQSGELAGLRERFQYADRDETGTDAMNQKLTSLRQSANSEYQWDQNQMKQDQAPVIRQIQTAIANDDDETYQALMQENPDLYNAPELVQSFNQTERTRTMQGREDLAHRQRQAEVQRQQQQRQTVEQVDSLVGDMVAGYDREGDESITSLRNKLTSMMPDDATVAQKNAAEQLLVQRLTGKGQLAEVDQKNLETNLEQFDSERNIRSNIFYGNEDMNVGQSVTRLADRYTTEDDDGNKLLLGANDSGTRTEMRNGMRRMLSSGVDLGNGQTVPVTEEVVDAALGSAKDIGWVYNSYADLENLVRQTVVSPGYRDQFSQYQNWKTERDQLEKQGKANLLKGRLFGSGGSGQQTQTTPAQETTGDSQTQPQPLPGNQPGGGTAIDDALQYLRSRPSNAPDREEETLADKEERLRNTPTVNVPGQIADGVSWAGSVFSGRAEQQFKAGLDNIENMDTLQRESFLTTFGPDLKNAPDNVIERLKKAFGPGRVEAYLN